MRSSSPTPTPGCFSIFGRSSKSSKQQTLRSSATTSSPFPSLAGSSSSYLAPKPSQQRDHLTGDFYGCCCGEITPAKLDGTEGLPAYGAEAEEIFKPEVRKTIKSTVASYDAPLRKLSLFISDNPELGFKEFKAHKALTDFLNEEGFEVERSWGGMETAFKATFRLKGDGVQRERKMGFCSEYDALPGVGHACGHNLIAIAGVAALLGIRAAMKKHSIAGFVVLIGTPAEEGGGGKVKLLEMGAYKGLDACMMVHPGPGPAHSGGVGGSLAIQVVKVEWFGKTAHAAGAPWEGINALDAANLAYSSISALRQQIKPAERVHGIITDGGLAPNVIPDHSAMKYYVRAPTASAVDLLRDRVVKCFEAAALATGCTVKIETEPMHMDLRNNSLLAREYKSAMQDLFNNAISVKTGPEAGLGGGSTDFGNCTYALPACHPGFAIPTPVGQANHTPGFTTAARSPEAHEETLKAATGIAIAGARILADEAFAKEAKSWFEEDMRSG